MAAVRTETKDGRFLMYTPFSRDFIQRIHGIGSAKWNGEAWTVNEDDAEAAKQFLREVYGEDGDTTGESYSVRIRVTSRMAKGKGPVQVMGKILASARGRDSGAYPGPDVVCLTEGGISSGGSRANWTSVVDGGTEFFLRHVGKAMAESSPEGVEVLSVELETGKMVDREALKSERDKLAARIEEIDRILAEAET